MNVKKKMTRAKTQSTPSSEKIGRYFPLRPWRLGAKIFVEIVLAFHNPKIFNFFIQLYKTREVDTL